MEPSVQASEDGNRIVPRVEQREGVNPSARRRIGIRDTFARIGPKVCDASAKACGDIDNRVACRMSDARGFFTAREREIDRRRDRRVSAQPMQVATEFDGAACCVDGARAGRRVSKVRRGDPQVDPAETKVKPAQQRRNGAACRSIELSRADPIAGSVEHQAPRASHGKPLDLFARQRAPGLSRIWHKPSHRNHACCGETHHSCNHWTCRGWSAEARAGSHTFASAGAFAPVPSIRHG